jgi:integrase
MTDIEQAAAPPLPALPVDQRPTADPYQVYLDSLDSAESRRTMRGCLDRIAKMQTGDPNATGAWQPWWLLRYEHTMAMRAALMAPEKSYSPDHINKHLNGLRRVLYTCWMLQLMSAEDYQRAASIKNVKGTRLPAGRNIHREELAAMLSIWEPAAAEGDPAALRNAALLAVLYSTGMRRFEASAVRIEHYDAGERTLRILGKRNKQRNVYISPSAVPVLGRWLAVVGTRRGPMFPRIHRTGKISAEGMSPRAVGYVVDRTRTLAGLPPTSTHDIRRTHTGDLLDAGVDLSTAQDLLGHASPTTTARYDRRPGRAARAAADRLTLPSSESLRDGNRGDHGRQTAP